MKKLEINQRRFKYGTLATVITIIFVAVVIFVNIVVSMLVQRFPLKLDLTANKAFTISDETIKYLKTLDTDIAITVLSDEATLENSAAEAKQVNEIINKYSQYSDKITVSYVNPDKNPEVITKFNTLYKGDLSSKFVVIQSGNRIKALSQTDLVTYTQPDTSGYAASNSGYTITSTAEEAMTSAIMSVTDLNPMKITVLTGESVSDITALTDMLGTNGYEIENVDALTGTIDTKSALVILNCPLNDLTSDEIDKLDSYLNNDGKLGKNLLYVASYQQKVTPNLDVFLAEWGIEVGTGYTMDSNTNNLAVLGNGIYGIYSTIDNKTYSGEVQTSTLPVIVPLSRPINLLYDKKDSRTTESLLKTADTAYVIPADADANTDISSLPQGAVNTMAVGSKYYYDDKNNKITSNILTLGSALMLNSSFTESTNLNNGDYVLSAINTMTGKSAGISIVSKDMTSTKLEITQTQAIIIRNIVIVFIPLIIIVVGIIIWARRRNR